VLTHLSVSRLHARLMWPEGTGRPLIEDLDSKNGVYLDGRCVSSVAELHDGATLTLGSLELTVELLDEPAPALLDEETSHAVRARAFSEVGGELRGPEQLRDLLLDLEAQRRTGTLTFCDGGELALDRGRVTYAAVGRRLGHEAMREIMQRPALGPYTFNVEASPREARMDASIRTLLEAGQRTTRGGVGKVAYLA
jgi:hypothetical protein